ncbi:MAG: DUF4384 domain-containing protein [Gemmatimonadetes bacterium]|jgi:hypothetical protein|nr:DUF4384 domain-containing protein [Gemmatimonadota bacterium]
MTHLYVLLLGAFLLGPTATAVQAEEQEWYSGEGIAPIVHITVEKARQFAWDQALVDALSQASLEVTGATMMKIEEGGEEGDDQFSQFVRTATRGRIVAVDTLFDEAEQRTVAGGARRELVYRVSMRAQVQPEMGRPDPGFQLELDLNKALFADGENLSLELTASRDCYVTLFNLYANDSLLVLLPNELLRDNQLQAGQTLSIPPRNEGWELPVGLLPGRETDREVLLAVATKSEIPFPAARVARQGLMSMDEALLTVNRWLAAIPSDQRTEAVAFYRIVK